MEHKKKKKLNYKGINVLKLLAFAFVFAGQIIPFKYSNAGEMRPVWSALSVYTYVGIGLAFTISGFLLMAHSHREYKYYKNFKLFNFWGRRIFKIIPLYLIVLFLGFIAIPNLVDFLRLNNVSLPSALPYLTFSANFKLIDSAQAPYFIAVLWPICVLLQVYFIWGLIAKSLWKIIEQTLLPLTLLSIIGAIVLFHYQVDAYKAVLGCLAFFFGGAYGALLVRKKSPVLTKFKELPIPFFTILHLITWGISLGLPFLLKGPILQTSYLALLPILFVMILWEQTFVKNSPFQLKKLKLFDTLGTYSYGLYMYHGLAFGLTIVIYDTVAVQANGFMIHVFFPILCLIITILVSQFSYPILEKPFIRMRRQFKRK